MGDLDALAIGGEQHGMVAHDVPGTHSREADGLARPRPGLAFATIDGNLLQIAPERLGHHLPHAQSGAGRRINLVPVMRLDDLDIHIVTQHARRGIQQLEAQIDANAEVGGEDDRDLSGRRDQALLLFRRKAGGTDHHGLAGAPADLQVLQRHRRVSEVDQHVELVDSLADISRQRHAQPPDGGQFAGIGTHQGTVRPIDGSGQTGDAASLLHRLDQGLAHAPGGARHCNTSHSISSKLQAGNRARGRCTRHRTSSPQFDSNITEKALHTLEPAAGLG